jgi:hypothetical protein
VQADADSGGGAEAGVKGGQWRRRCQEADSGGGSV